jgi:ankyrin repeat protein
MHSAYPSRPLLPRMFPTSNRSVTQNKRKRQPNESTRNMSRELGKVLMRLLGREPPSRELFNALISLLKRRRTYSTILEEVNVLIKNYTEKDLQEAVLVKNDDGWLPIHCACYVSAPVEVIRLLLDIDHGKKSIFEKESLDRRLPLHYACGKKNPSVKVIQLLLDSDMEKKSILEKDKYGRLPIHKVCERAAPVEVIQLLLDNDAEHKTIFEKDHRGRLPIHIACEVNAPVAVIQLLLQASICDRIEQLGLAQWKVGMEKLINEMTADKSKTEKVQQIYERLSKYEEMEHTVSLLALAVWRTSCLHWGDIKFISMQGMEDLRATNYAFDSAEYKRERRIKSGVDVIIRGVLPFLPVDDDTPPF